MKSWRFRFALLPLLVAAVAIVIWNLSRDKQKPFALADGSQIIFLRTTLGTNHSHCYGNVFQKIAGHLPGRFRDKLNGRTTVRTRLNGRTNAVFWFRCRESLSGTNVTFFPFADGRSPDSVIIKSSPAHFPLLVKFKDENGIDLRGTIYSQLHKLPSGEIGLAIYLKDIPSYCRSLHLLLYRVEPSEGGKLAEFSAPNPVYHENR